MMRQSTIAETPPQKRLRQILESLRLQCDSCAAGQFTFRSFIISLFNEQEKEIDALRDNELLKLGFLPLRFREEWVLKFPDMVAMIIQSYTTMEEETKSSQV